MLDIDAAIKHCLEVAEQNETSAITYKNCKEIKTNMYEKLTAEKAENDCRECAADHRQLAEWLKELKEAKRLLKAAVEEDVNGKIAFSKSVLVYLVYDNGFTYITNDRCRVDSKSWLHEIPGEGCKVTHWMPLPEPPKDGDTNG